MKKSRIEAQFDFVSRGAEVSDCGEYILITTHQECRDNLVYFTKCKGSEEITGLFDLTQVVYKFEHDFEYIANNGSKFVFRTNRDAPNYRLVTIDLDYTPTDDNVSKQNPWPMTTLIPESKDQVLEWATVADDNKLILCYLKDVKSVMFVHDLNDGKQLFNIPLDIGSVTSVFARRKYSEFYFMFNSTIIPSVSYKVNYLMFDKALMFPLIFVKFALFDKGIHLFFLCFEAFNCRIVGFGNVIRQ